MACAGVVCFGPHIPFVQSTLPHMPTFTEHSDSEPRLDQEKIMYKLLSCQSRCVISLSTHGRGVLSRVESDGPSAKCSILH